MAANLSQVFKTNQDQSITQAMKGSKQEEKTAKTPVAYWTA